MLLGRSVVSWIVAFFVAACIFIIATWLIPLIFGLIGVAIPRNVVNVLALLIAVGCVYYWPRVA